MRSKVSSVEFDRIERDFGNVRSDMGDIGELADSIASVGLLEPLVVWHKRRGGKDGPHVLSDGREVYDRYILLSGNRRYAAIQHIRSSDSEAFVKVPVTLFTGSELDALLVQITENVQRKDLGPDEAAGALRLLSNYGLSQEAMAKRLGKSQAWVSRILAYDTKVPEPVKASVREGMAIDTALSLATKPEEEQAAATSAFFDAKSSGASNKAANKAAREAAGTVSKPGPKMVRAQYDTLADARQPSREVKLAARILGWVLGENEWPNGDLPEA